MLRNVILNSELNRCEIELNDGSIAYCPSELFDLVCNYNWVVDRGSNGKLFVAGNGYKLYLHLLSYGSFDSVLYRIDFLDGNGLNCLRENLILVRRMKRLNHFRELKRRELALLASMDKRAIRSLKRIKGKK
jgi:hypothetical protein